MTDTKPRLVPGDQFDVAYGDDKTTAVTCLSLFQQRKLADLVKELIEAEQSGDGLLCMGTFEKAEAAIRIAKPGVSDEFMETIDAEMAIQIATACLGKQAVEDTDKKKSE